MPFYFSKNILAENPIQTSMTYQHSTHPTITNSCITNNCECYCQNYICNCVCSTQYPERTTIDAFNQGSTITTVSNKVETTGGLISTYNPITTHETLSTITDPETISYSRQTFPTITTVNYNYTYKYNYKH